MTDTAPDLKCLAFQYGCVRELLTQPTLEFYYFQPNERPGESLLDLDFDPFKPDGNTTIGQAAPPITQVHLSPFSSIIPQCYVICLKCILYSALNVSVH